MDDRIRFSLGGLTCICLPDIHEKLVNIYQDSRWVYDEFMARPGVELIRGRRPLVCGSLGPREVIIKRLYHGGLLARVTGDRFWNTSRLTGALESEEYLKKHNVRTAVTEFVSWRRLGGFVRCEVGVRRLGNGRDASDFFFPASGRQPAQWEQWAARLGKVVKQLHEIQFIHPDLNLMNFYFTHDENIVILDLDKGEIPACAASQGKKQKNIIRLLRSIRKQGALFAGSYVQGIITVIEEAYRE